MMRFRPCIAAAGLALLAVTCMQPVTGGGGSEVEVVGSVYLSGNEPAPATQVKLIPYDYDPSVMAAIGDSLIDTSDLQGRYSFDNIAPGKYNILAVQLIQRTRMLVTGLDVDTGVTTVAPETLREPGAIKLMLLDNTTHNGYATIPGTDIAVFVAAGAREIRLDSVPPGTIPEVRYTVLGDTAAISRKDVVVEAAATTILTDPSWQYRRQLLLNTSTAGAAISGDVYEFPVLIRLGADNFDFAQTKIDGTDLRFTAANGAPLPSEIEQWDAVAKLAVVWVNVDTIRGDDSTQSIAMHWGNAAATPQSGSAAVFDTAAGFAGVWHLGDVAGDSIRDATINRYYGTSPDTASPAISDGIIGKCRAFNGAADYIVMPNTADSKLNFQENDSFTVSAWVSADTFDNVYRAVVAKGFRQYFLWLTYFPSSKPLWEFSDFSDVDNWHMSNTPAEERQWVLLTGVRQGSSQSLFCNGELVANTSATYPQSVSRDTSNDLTVGRFLTEATFPAKFGFCFFKGRIDEVRISSVAQSSDWMRLSYMNQRIDDRFVQFK